MATSPGRALDATMVWRALHRADDLVKHAGNRRDPTVAHSDARDVLERATGLLDAVADPDERDELRTQVERRLADLDQQTPPDATRRRDIPRSPRASAPADRVPPGQRLVAGWPVLHVGRIPSFNPAIWRFRTTGKVTHRLELHWDEFRNLPPVTRTSDFHCVTGWSRLDNTWDGVSFREIASRAEIQPNVTHALIYGHTAYSANLPLDVLMDDDVIFAWSHDGEPLTAEHGGPLRLVVPSRYAWKSVKWCHTVQFLERDVHGFWEERGYHNTGDPFLEQRYRNR